MHKNQITYPIAQQRQARRDVAQLRQHGYREAKSSDPAPGEYSFYRIGQRLHLEVLPRPNAPQTIAAILDRQSTLSLREAA